MSILCCPRLTRAVLCAPSDVWIDTLSVIQRRGNLQQTLLARMMAVYSSAGMTLALRSLEEKHNRYHQRVWTLQEFCSARELRLATQDTHDDARSSKQAEDTTKMKEGSEPLLAYVEHEALITRRLRRDMVNGSMAVSPFWLYGSQVVQDVERTRELWHKFEMLSGILTCLNEPDKIRWGHMTVLSRHAPPPSHGIAHPSFPALAVERGELMSLPAAACRAIYPMLFLTTVESQDELIELADKVAESTGGKTPPGLAILKSGIKRRKELAAWRAPSGKFLAPSARRSMDE